MITMPAGPPVGPAQPRTLKSAIFDEHASFEFLDETKIDDAAKWAAGGFMLLAGLLGFLGIKEGVLDRLLRDNPDRALFIFLLVGIGVVLSLLAPAFRADQFVNVPAICAVIAVLGGIAVTLGWDERSTGRMIISIVGFALLALLAGVLWHGSISLVAAALILAVVSTSMGLYAAATLAVASKTLPEKPRVSGALVEEGGREVVKVVAKASKRENKDLVVLVLGHAVANDDAGVELGHATFGPDGVGEIDATQTFPVFSVQWAALSVAYCADTDCKARSETVRLRPDRGGTRVGAAVTVEAGAVHAAVTAVGVAPGTIVRVRVERVRGRSRLPYLAWLVGDAEGRAQWSAKVAETRPGDVVLVWTAVCPGKCGGRSQVARYRVA
jgi:hypothetical protein